MTRDESLYLRDVASLGCLACRNLGLGESAAEIHHIRSGIGKGQRASHYDTIPLCPIHHRLGGVGVAFHASPKTWQQEHGSEIDLVAQTRRDVEQLRGSIIGRV